MKERTEEGVKKYEFFRFITDHVVMALRAF